MSMASEFRSEPDSMGQVAVPAWAYWGAQTQRAVDNFQISGIPLPPAFIRALGLIKRSAASVNAELGLLGTAGDPQTVEAVVTAAGEVAAGLWDRHFPIDVFQTGSGTSTNMNANEVIANRANELLGNPLGSRKPVHPNDHVNRCQSSNDVIPAAVQLSCRVALVELEAAVAKLAASLRAKEAAFAGVIKLGRTHLQDAVPMTLGQEFGAWAAQVEKAGARLASCRSELEELPLGGTAIGTGLNAHPEFGPKAAAEIARLTGLPFRMAPNRFEQIAARDAQVQLMGCLNTLATSLMKIVNDLRLLASGPRGALGEINLPSLQPGSSIMPGKVNPVIPEMVLQVAAHVSGKLVSVTMGGQNGPLELNMANPLIAYECLGSLDLLAKACVALAEKCVDGIEADEARCAWWIDWSLALVTPLNTRIGYDKAAQLAYRAFREKRQIREILLEVCVREEKIMDEAELDRLLDPWSMAGR
jgi:fumarate hydratase class II